ncbi:MAG: EAL domain-containing protein, partial [Collinsella aerofaciens]
SIHSTNASGASSQREREDQLLSAFQHALNQGRITFHIQPQYDMETKKIIGGEALARWKDEDGSFISPGTFVPLLERNGFGVTLDRHIWSLVFAWLSERLAQGLPCVPISVNISQTDLISVDVAKQLERLAMRYAVPTHYVKAEITESAYADDPKDVTTLASKLRSLGFSVLIDDFGSGSSSLSMLQNIDADVIKLDGRFMSVETGQADKGESIVKSVINMSWQIGLPVIVEGVETDKQIAFLHELGVRYVQGFYYYRPMPINAFEELIADSASIDPRGILLQNSSRTLPPQHGAAC